MRRLSLAPQTIADTPPDRFVRIARAAGFDHVGLRTMTGDPATAIGPAAIADVATARTVRAILDGEGVAAVELEFVTLRPTTDIAACRAGLERGAMLGTSILVAASDDRDVARRNDAFAALAALAADHGHRLAIEFVPWCAVDTVARAADLARAAGHGAGILVDAIHLARGGGGASDIASLDPALLATFQICDAPALAPTDRAEIYAAARDERLDPGVGGLAIAAMLAALPPDSPISVEVPSLSRVSAIGATAHVGRVRAATLALLQP